MKKQKIIIKNTTLDGNKIQKEFFQFLDLLDFFKKEGIFNLGVLFKGGKDLKGNKTLMIKDFNFIYEDINENSSVDEFRKLVMKIQDKQNKLTKL